MGVPYYYSRLAPFRRLFRTGVPVLCYHHINAPRRGARLKWLYVSPKIFSHQIAELRSEGFSTPDLFAIHSPSGRFCKDAPDSIPNGLAQPHENNLEPYQASLGTSDLSSQAPTPQSLDCRVHRPIVLTFDDGFCDVFEHALPVLQSSQLRGIAFLVSDLLGKVNDWQLKMGDVIEPIMDEGQIREWLAAGQRIGAHTKTHPRLTQVSLDAAREEIVGSKKSLEDRFGVPIYHFCYPFGDWNRHVRDLVIEAGYKTASTVNPGVNTSETSPFQLNRFTALSNTWSLNSLWKRLLARLLRIDPAIIPRGSHLRPEQSPALRSVT